MSIGIKRIYEKAEAGDGTRILVDRLWPRGLSRDAAQVDYWAKDLSPSGELRKWYGHDPAKWEAFKDKYFAELEGNPAAVKFLSDKLAHGQVTFLYSSTERMLNNAQALKIYLERKLAASASPRR
jgi:uncharacterized protein YeaO (DUF488 family)